MPWEQFEEKELDGRLQLIAGYLATRLHYNRVVVDLNCGTAPLLDWLPHHPPEWGRYYGNDTCEDFIDKARNKRQYATMFECIPDSEVVDSLSRHSLSPSILLCLGYAARLNKHESQTLEQSIEDIVAEHKPEIVILEHWSGITASSLMVFLEGGGYVEEYAWSLDTIKNVGVYTERIIRIWKLKDA